MTGFILAAGFGTRLQPITNHIPKALVSVAGKPLLGRSLQFLKKKGIGTIGVNSHYLSEQLEQFRKKSPISFEIFHEDTIRGTGGALYFARDFLSKNDIFFVLNVDIICEFDLGAVIEHFKKSSFDCLLIAFPYVNVAGTIIYDECSSTYIGTTADVKNSDALSADFIGAALYKRKFLSLLDENDFSIVPVWTRAFEAGMSTGVYIVRQGYWRDIGTPRSLAQIHFDVIDRKIDLDIPDDLIVNHEKRYCVPQSVADRTFPDFENSWIETEQFDSTCSISNSVIFSNCSIDAGSKISNSLVSPWGVVDLNG